MSKVQLLVEGKYDANLVLAILNRTRPDLANHFELKNCGGLALLLEAVEAELLGPEPVVAVLCDADQDCSVQWREVQASCKRGGLDLGEAGLSQDGFLLKEEGRRKFGCWIMPDNMTSGSIEAFLLNGINSPVQSTLRIQAEQFVASAEPRLFPDTDAAQQKATLRAWFAVQEEPIWLPSFAVGQSLLLPELSAEAPFVQWLSALAAMLD
jgi:hypothetical protein